VNREYDVTARMVLLKSVSDAGFSFYSNYLSPKAQDLKEIPKAALVFWWPLCQRQVRITGVVAKLDSKSSDQYFASRNKGSKMAAIVSKQSSVITSRDDLLSQYQALAQQYENNENIQRPAYWGGYILAPQVVEFWQGRKHRLHDRFQYRKQENKWDIFRLSP